MTPPGIRVLVCGDRNWTNKLFIWDVLDNLHMLTPITCVIEGEARGADVMGRQWAQATTISFQPYHADWNGKGRAAGPIRNQKMLDEGKPDIVLAFHNSIETSKGTKDMIRRAKKQGVPVRLYTEQGEQL